jgi:ABC-type arginine transport system ATPase subunit/ribosomal protein L19E
MAKIKFIRVKRFKQLIDFELDLADTTVLIGANNAGKSSVLQALHFAVAVAQTSKLVGDGVSWRSDKFELSFNPSQLLYSPVADVLTLANGGDLNEDKGRQIEIEIALDDATSCLVVVRRGRNRNIQVVLKGKVVGERLMNQALPFTVYAPGLAGIAKEERYMSPGVVRRIVARGDANLVLRNVLCMIHDQEKREKSENEARLKDEYPKAMAVFQKNGGEKPEYWIIEAARYKGPWTKFQSDMRELFPGITVEVRFDHAKDETIEVFFKQPKSPKLPIDAAGTSILQASQILAYITLFKPEILILDEPDSHLHPNNQRALCDLVNNLTSSKNFKALLSTHSRHVLDSLQDRAKVVWLNGGKKIDYDVFSTPAMLLELGALDSIDYFAQGHLKCLFATEDSSKESIAAVSTILTSNGYPMAAVEIRPYSGCTKLDAAKVLRAFLTEKAPNVSFIVHRDRDYMDNASAEKFECGLISIQAHPFLTDFSDVDSYFLNAAHIAELNPLISRERVQELIDIATANTKNESVSSLINIRTEAAIRGRNGGPAHNAGALAAQANADYESDPVKWRRGKIVLRTLRSLLHQELKTQAELFTRTDHLKLPKLEKLRLEIWPDTAEVG